MRCYQNAMRLFPIILIFLIVLSVEGTATEEGNRQTNTASASLIVIGIEQNETNNTEETVLIMEEQSSISIEDQYNEQRRQQTNQLTGFAVSTDRTQNVEKSLLSILILLSITLIGLLGYLHKQSKKS